MPAVGYPETSASRNIPKDEDISYTICLNASVNRHEFIQRFWVMLKLGAGDKDGETVRSFVCGSRSFCRLRLAFAFLLM